MKSSGKNIKNKAVSRLTSEIWNSTADEAAVNRIVKHLKSNPDALEKLKHNDPASVLFLLGSDIRRALDTERPELKALSIGKKAGIKRAIKNTSNGIFHILFGSKWRFAAAGALFIIFYGIALITMPELFRLRPRHSSGSIASSSEDLKKNGEYDRDIIQETVTIRQNTSDAQALNGGGKSITSNLVADGEKVIHYTTETGTEVIFVTGLN